MRYHEISSALVSVIPKTTPKSKYLKYFIVFDLSGEQIREYKVGNRKASNEKANDGHE